jgi:hypothetical protein
MTAEPLDAVVLVLFFVAVLAICAHNWLREVAARKAEADDSFYRDPALPRMVDPSLRAQTTQTVDSIASALGVEQGTGDQVIADEMNGTVRLTLVSRRK